MLTIKDDFFSTSNALDPILNWRLSMYDSISGKNYTMADGYYKSSIFLINECLVNNNDKKGDIWIFPIMFCVNQFIELYLKGILTQLKQIDSSESSDWNINISEGSHNINILSKKLYEYQNLNLKHFLEPIEQLQVIVDFTEILSKQEGFDFTFARYPTAKNNSKTKKSQPNKRQFYNNSYENCGLNLRLYLQWVKEIHNILDGITHNLGEQIYNLKYEDD